MAQDEIVIMGRFGAPYGIKGWIKVLSYTDPIENLFDYKPWLIRIKDEWQVIEVNAEKIHGNILVVHVDKIDDRDEVRKFTNYDIGIERKKLPQLPENEFYWLDLINLQVITIQGRELGRVDHLLATGANDILVVKGEKEYLIPYTDPVIKKVDLKNQTILVDWEIDF